jgi:hypothetical protein
MQKNLVQQLTEELTAQTKRAQALQQIVNELFTIAAPGAVKNALWARYQGIEGASPQQSQQPRGFEAEDLSERVHEDWANEE